MKPKFEGDKPWRSVGYYQSFFCSETSKDKAKLLVAEFYYKKEGESDRDKFRYKIVVQMHSQTTLDQLSIPNNHLTEEMFENRKQTGIWYIGAEEYYVSDSDCAASMTDFFSKENHANL